MRVMLLVVAVLLWGCAPEPGAPDPAPAPPTAGTPDGLPNASSPAVSDAWVRAVPPAARMTAGYLSVHNPGAEPLVIVGAESTVFRAIEMHGTVTVDGMARMRQEETVTVAPGESLRFEPGGLHLMLMEPVNGIPSSGAIDISLLLKDGERLDFSAPIGQPAD
jgi:periplasmic copper chaperone A